MSKVMYLLVENYESFPPAIIGLYETQEDALKGVAFQERNNPAFVEDRVQFTPYFDGELLAVVLGGDAYKLIPIEVGRVKPRGYALLNAFWTESL